MPLKIKLELINQGSEAKVFSHVTFMIVLFRPVNNFLGQVIGNASEGKFIRGSDLSKMPEFGDYHIFI